MTLLDLSHISGDGNKDYFQKLSDKKVLESYIIKEHLKRDEYIELTGVSFLLFEQGTLAIDSFSFEHSLEKVNQLLLLLERELLVKVYVLSPDLLNLYIKEKVTNLRSGVSVISDSEASKQFNALMLHAHKLGANDIYIHLSSSESTALATFKVNGELSGSTYPLRDFSLGRAICASIFDGKDGAGIQSGSFDDVTSPQRKNIHHTVLDELGVPVQDYEYRYTKTVTKGPGEMLVNLRPQGRAMHLRELGLNDEDKHHLDAIIKAVATHGGMSLICGQTGSGKSMTNYAFLLALPRTKSIQTFEDPIEITKPSEFVNITQNSLNRNIGVANQLSSIMTQAPDCMFLQEIRDIETAKFAVNTALTGHGLVSSIHAKNPFGIVQRLESLGIQREQLASIGLLKSLSSQVLVKELCPHCSLPFQSLSSSKQNEFSPSLSKLRCKSNKNVRFKNDEGCHHCNNTGELGRFPIIEILEIKEGDLSYISSGNYIEWRENRVKAGHKTIKDKALLAFKAGRICLSRFLEMPDE